MLSRLHSKYRLPANLFVLLLAALLSSPSSYADTHSGWQLNNALSKLSFVSIKATDVGEVHSFTRLEGSLSDEGEVNISVDLTSVETLIPIRNERMQQMLFETGNYPAATINASLDAEALAALTAGSVQLQAVEATLTLKDKVIPLTTQLIAARVGEDRLMVSSLQPVLMVAASMGLSEGVEKLREVAGLPSISQAVPVSVVLTFEK